MLEHRTHEFTMSARELRAALRLAFPDNLRIATMPESFTLSSQASCITVSYRLRVEEAA